MTPDLGPTLEDAARRRLTELVDRVSVPHALSAPGPGGPRRRSTGHRVLLTATVAGVAAAAAAAIVVVPSSDSPDTVTGPSSNDRSETPPATSSSGSSGAASGGPSDGVCESHVADDGVLAAGTLPDGERWEVRVQGEPPNVSTRVTVDGEVAGEMRHDELSWPAVLNDGFLSLNVGVTEHGALVFGEVPLATASVQVRDDEGGATRACPASVPTHDILGYFAATLAPGERPAEVRALDAQGRLLASGDLSGLGDAATTTMNVDPSRVSLPLGGSSVEAPPPLLPALNDIVTGELPSGSWSLGTDHVGERLILQLRLPGGSAVGLQSDDPDGLVGSEASWSVLSADDGFVVWGPVAAEVAAVTFTLDDGSTVEASTVETIPETSIRAFAAAFPEGATITGVVGQRADGSTAVRATDVAEQMAHLSGPDATSGTFLTVVPVERARWR